MATVFAFHTGKSVVRVAAIEIPINYLLDIGPPEAVLPGEMLVIDPDKSFKFCGWNAYLLSEIATAAGRDREVNIQRVCLSFELFLILSSETTRARR